MIRTRTFAVACAGALALAGCGGGSITGGDASTTTTEAETASQTATTIAETTTTAAERTTTTTTVMETTTTTVARSSTSAPAQTVPEDDGGDAVTGEVPEDLMAQVFAAAEAETGADRSEMTVLRAESVIWSDGSLGCPEPGMMYTQATVDGHWVELSVGERTLDYRLSAGGEIRLCAAGQSLPGRDDS